jgi:hypothetical protein
MKRLLLTALLVITAFAAGACNSPERQRKKMLAQLGPPQPSLTASVLAFDGKVRVTAHLGSLQPLPPPSEKSGPPGGGGGGPPPGMMPPGFASGEMRAAMRYPMIAPPRMVLTLTFTNLSDASVELRPLGVDTVIGVFAPRPERVVLAPGAGADLDGMTSSYAANFDQLDVTLAVAADAGGTSPETIRLSLKSAPGVSLPPASP